MGNRLKADFLAEADLPCDRIVAAFNNILKGKYGLETKRIANGTNQFLSKDYRYSFFRSIIKTIPPQIEWCIEQLSSTKCSINISFSLPPRLKRFLCLIFILLGGLLSATGSAILKYGEVGFNNITDPTSLALLISVFVGMGAIILFHMLLVLYLRLLERYVSLGSGLLKEACESCQDRDGLTQFKPVPLKSRLVIDWKIIIFGIIAFCGVPLIMVRDEVMRAIITSKFSLMVLIYGIAVTLFYVTSWQMQKRHSLIGKAVAIAPNFCLVFSIASLLFGIPAFMYARAKSVIHLFTTAAIENSLSTIEQSNMVLAGVRLQSLGMCSAQFMLWILAIAVIVLFYRRLADFWRNSPTAHRKYMEETFHTEAANSDKMHGMSLRLPLMTKISIVLIFFVFSTCCWTGMFLNLSLLNAVIVPRIRLVPIPYGETIAQGTMLMARAMLRGRAEDWSVHALRLVLIAPALFPFVLLIFLHIKALFVSYLKTHSLAPIEGDMDIKTNNIAAQVGVSNILCRLDKRSSRISPYAVVRGWYPKKMIVFTPRSLSFLSIYPEHAEAIIAHEVAHLKHDCLKLWILRLLSRLGLVGVGFLSVLHDSVAMEDRADNAARLYLCRNGKNESLLVEAAYITEAQVYMGNKLPKTDQHASVACLPDHNTNCFGGLVIGQSLFMRIVTALRIAHDVYFQAELYDYVHRETRYRHTQSNLKRTGFAEFK